MDMIGINRFFPVAVRWIVLGIVFLVLPGQGQDDAPQAVNPYETADQFQPVNTIDTLILASLQKQGISPAPLCSDEVFVRRVFLDVIGTLPRPEEIKKFLSDKSPDKRARLIDSLLARDEFADYWALKWCDVLRVKAEFPINLWPNAVQAYHHWVHAAIKDNMPYDQFSRQLLTSSGSNFRVPPVNFYRAVQGRKPATMAAAAALTFMGTRLDSWPADQRAAMEVFFSRLSWKYTAEWKEEIVCLDPGANEPLQAVLPDGKTVTISAGVDPREVFANWLITADNPWFARSIVNRVWAWLLGRGLIHEPDDIRPDNPAVHPEALAWLQQEFIKSNYDLRQLYRLILNSRTWQQSFIPRGDPAKTETLFACYPVRQLDAEVLIDALCYLSGTRESYSSLVPEPYTFIPEESRTIQLADGSITSQFLEMFGRPSRDTGLFTERNLNPTDSQRLHMLNSSHVQGKIEASPWLRDLAKGAKVNIPNLINGVYLHILSRSPTTAESAAAAAYFKTKGVSTAQGASDLAWALINSKEFLFRH